MIRIVPGRRPRSQRQGPLPSSRLRPSPDVTAVRGGRSQASGRSRPIIRPLCGAESPILFIRCTRRPAASSPGPHRFAVRDPRSGLFTVSGEVNAAVAVTGLYGRLGACQRLPCSTWSTRSPSRCQILTRACASTAIPSDTTTHHARLRDPVSARTSAAPRIRFCGMAGRRQHQPGTGTVPLREAGRRQARAMAAAFRIHYRLGQDHLMQRPELADCCPGSSRRRCQAFLAARPAGSRIVSGAPGSLVGDVRDVPDSWTGVLMTSYVTPAVGSPEASLGVPTLASAPDRRWQRAALFLARAEQLMTISMPVTADPYVVPVVPAVGAVEALA